MHPLEANALRTTRALIDRSKTHRAELATTLEETRLLIQASQDLVTRLQAKCDQLPGVRR